MKEMEVLGNRCRARVNRKLKKADGDGRGGMEKVKGREGKC